MKLTLEETLKLLATLKVAYINEYKNLTKADIQILTNLWYQSFQEFTFDDVNLAINTYITTNTSKFAPNIAEIKELIIKEKFKDHKTAIDAFLETREAIRGRREFSELNKICQDIIGSETELRSLGQQSSEYITTFFRPQFVKMYNEKLNETFLNLAKPKVLIAMNQNKQLESKGDKNE